jgi:hypothetical protein
MKKLFLIVVSVLLVITCKAQTTPDYAIHAPLKLYGPLKLAPVTVLPSNPVPLEIVNFNNISLKIYDNGWTNLPSASELQILRTDIDNLESTTLPSVDLETALGASPTITNMKSGIFYARDYVQGGVYGQAAIQRAINAAHNYATSSFNGGTVIISAGIWNITSCDTLKSNIYIDAALGAQFVFPKGYTGYMWYHNGIEPLTDVWVRGGKYIGDTYRTATVIYLRSDTDPNYIMRVGFSDMFMLKVKIGIDLITNSTGWVNANTFKNIFVWDFWKGIRTTAGVGTLGIDGNLFSDIMLQKGDTASRGIDITYGDNNVFSNITFFDFVTPAKNIVFGSTTSNNCILSATGIIDSLFVNSGWNNSYMTNHSFQPGTDKHMRLATSYAGNSVIYGGNESATTGSIGVSGTSYTATGTGSYTGVKGTATGANTGTNIGVYGSASEGSINYAGYFDGDVYIKNLISLPKPTGNVTANVGITAAMLSTVMLYNGNSAIDISSNPQIAAGSNGQQITIVGISNTNTLTLEDFNGIELASDASCVLGAYDAITLLYLDFLGTWIEVSRSNN